jgi:hypothetical protein
MSLRTINKPDIFFKNLSAGNDGVFDWEWLNDAFKPSKITLTDIDAIVERNGQFLVIETKNSNHLPQGQKILLEQLVRKGNFTIFYVVGKNKDNITFLEIWGLDKNKKIMKYKQQKPSGEILFQFVKKWFKMVENHKEIILKGDQ